MKNQFTGTGVAIVTPFFKNGDIDLDSLTRLLDYIIDNGVDFVVALGTTSEAVTLNSEEKNRVMERAKQTVNGRVPIVMGMGGNNTRSVVNEIAETDFTGIDGILSVAPYYNKPNQRGLYQHFAAIAKASPLPIVLYNVPGRTSSNCSSNTTLKLAEDFANIVAVKEASGDFNQIMEIIKNKPEGFEVLSGDDALTLPLMAVGAKGVISVVANAFPRDFSEMVNHCLSNQFEKASPIHYQLLEIIDQLFADGNPAGVKAALSIQNICENQLRLPMVPLTDSHFETLKSMIINPS